MIIVPGSLSLRRSGSLLLEVLGAMKGWWVYAPYLGGLAIKAESRSKARLIGADIMNAEYIHVRARRLPALDAAKPDEPGEVDNKEAERLGAIATCQDCGMQYVILGPSIHCPECGSTPCLS